MKCIYCNEFNHKIYNCDKGLELNNLLEELIEPDFNKLTLRQLQRIASMNNIKISLKKSDLVLEIKELWKKKERLRIINYETDECCICLDNIHNNNYSILPCGHKFHFSCILYALNKKQQCPICRIEITFEQNNEVSDDEDINQYIEQNVDLVNQFIVNAEDRDNLRVRSVTINNLIFFFTLIKNSIDIFNFVRNNSLIKGIVLSYLLYFIFKTSFLLFFSSHLDMIELDETSQFFV
tara:strand:- start:904 stop:1614 length:711 start_codon:yes stop_codon:yes gene_type:complete